MKASDDGDLIQRTLDGDWDAFGGLVSRYQASTIALAMRQVGNAADAQDIAQDVFLIVYQKLRQLKHRDRFAGWLRSVTLRRCQMWWRSQAGKPDFRPIRESAAREHFVNQEERR